MSSQGGLLEQQLLKICRDATERNHQIFQELLQTILSINPSSYPELNDLNLSDKKEFLRMQLKQIHDSMYKIVQLSLSLYKDCAEGNEEFARISKDECERILDDGEELIKNAYRVARHQMYS